MDPKPQLFTLGEATVDLYPAGPDGRTITGSAVWIGACAESLRLASRLEDMRLAATGAAYARRNHTDEQHEIQIDRLWVLRNPDRKDYRLERNQQYVLSIRWVDEKTGVWHREIYYGVTARSFERASNSVMEFMAAQVWDAQYYECSSGTEALIPVADEDGTTDQVLFVHDQNLVHTLDVPYFTGIYQWIEDRVTISAKVIGRSGSGSASVFTLEVDGVLTAHTITLPLGSNPGDEVSSELVFETVLPANTDVRWKCTSGPADVEDGPYAVAIVMQIRD